MIEIDGSLGEGGGQIIRTALALSLVTGKRFHVSRIRAGRKVPGLQNQHLVAVQAASQIGQAEAKGAAIGSQELTFVPGEVNAGSYTFKIGTAGSTMLVLQTILLPLMIAGGHSFLTLEGGTHNPFAPPFDFVTSAFLPLVARTGPRISAKLMRYGFYPRGGGRVEVRVEPVARLAPLTVKDRGSLRQRRAQALVVNLPRQIAQRELEILRNRLTLRDDELSVITSDNSSGAGNVVIVELACEHVTVVITALGERGIPAEAVAEKAAQEAQHYLSSGAAVDKHLADQLLIPMAMAGGGAFTTCELTLHTRTNIEIIKKFLDVDIECRQTAASLWEITMRN